MQGVMVPGVRGKESEPGSAWAFYFFFFIGLCWTSGLQTRTGAKALCESETERVRKWKRLS